MNTKDYNRPILMFSGGKDSLACLYILEQLEQTNFTAVWVDTGKNFNQILKTIEYAMKRFPNIEFLQLRVNRDAQWETKGLPTDVMNLDYSKKGNMYLGTSIKFQSRFSCCFENIMLPVLTLIKEWNSNLLIRGNKLSDSSKDYSKSGDIIDGVTIWNPVQDWDDNKVRQYLREKMGEDYPKHLDYNHSSLDCRDCTAYLSETRDRIELLRQEHPLEYDIFRDNLFNIRHSVLEQVNEINKIL